jgi:hypothetical protein
MVSTYTTNKSLEKPGNGDYVNTWNIPVNGDMDVLDQALGGLTYLNAGAGSATLTASQYRSLMLYAQGSIAADVTFTLPAGVGGFWNVLNTTTLSNPSGSNNIIIKSATGGGTSVTVNPNIYTQIGCDGTNVFLTNNQSAMPTGGGSNQVFYRNDQVITNNYTLPYNQNAGTFGPITLNSGVTVTIEAGATWSIV